MCCTAQTLLRVLLLGGYRAMFHFDENADGATRGRFVFPSTWQLIRCFVSFLSRLVSFRLNHSFFPTGILASCTTLPRNSRDAQMIGPLLSSYSASCFSRFDYLIRNDRKMYELE